MLLKNKKRNRTNRIKVIDKQTIASSKSTVSNTY